MNFLYPQVFILLLAVFWLYQTGNKKGLSLYASLILMIFALSSPVIQETRNDKMIKAKDLIIALDISYSMNAKDIKPSRLNVAKKMIEKTFTKNKTDRFALFAFTSNPLILSPSTTDHKLLITALNSLKTENILTHSTNLENLIKRVSKIKMRQKNILLFSDGGDILDIENLISICQKEDIRIFSIGLGTKKGAVLTNKYKQKIKDEKGNLVISRLNPYLKNLSLKSGGQYFSFEEFDFSLDFMDDAKFAQKQKSSFTELFGIPLLLAIVLFWLYFVRIPKKILAIIPFLTLESNAGLLDWYYIDQANKSYKTKTYKQSSYYFEKIRHKTMQSQMNLANSYYQLGSYKKAKSIYKNLQSTNARTKKIIFYKLGNCNAKLEKYNRAKEHYRSALYFGKDEDILYNLKQISFKIDKNRRDFPAFHSEDKQRENIPSESKEKETTPKKDNIQKNKKEKTVEKNFERPLGYKAYELINRGYIDEKKPW